MTVDATPFVVEKLSASVSGCHGRVWSRSVQPVHRSTTVSPRSRTTSAPPPRPRVTSFPNDSATRPKPRAAWPRTSGGSGRACGGKSRTLRQPPVGHRPSVNADAVLPGGAGRVLPVAEHADAVHARALDPHAARVDRGA